jgi:hypothetical protein
MYETEKSTSKPTIPEKTGTATKRRPKMAEIRKFVRN